MSKLKKDPPLAEVLRKLSEAYEEEHRLSIQAEKVPPDDERELLTDRRRSLEIRALRIGLRSTDDVEWVSATLLDAMRFLNGRALERAPNLHFMAEEAQKEGSVAGQDIRAIATTLADQEIRKACKYHIQSHVFLTVRNLKGSSNAEA